MKAETFLRKSEPWPLAVFVLALIGFNLFAVSFIHLPHFWDEAWVYVPAMKSMVEKGISLFPHTIPVDLTRGHPLLFHATGASWLNLFGTSNQSTHLFALLISNLTLVVVFFGLRKMIDGWGALFAVLAIALQPVFLAQSGMVFPEMFLTMFVLLAFFAYHRQKTWLFVLALSCALYTKESGLVYFLAFLIWDVFRVLFMRDSWRLLMKFVIPVLVIASHPIILYFNFEWFLFPEHTSLILENFEDVKWQLRRVFDFNFHLQGREWLFLPLMALTVLGAKIRPFWVKILLLAIGFSAYKVYYQKWITPEWAFILILTVACVAPILLWWRFRDEGKPGQTAHFLAVAYAALVGYIVFSATNFFTFRYLLSSILLVTVVVSIGLWKSILPKPVKLLISLGLLVFPLYHSLNDREIGETDLGLHDDLRAQQRAMNWMIENVPQDAWVCTNFVTAHYLSDPFAGYVSPGQEFLRLHVNYCLTPCETEYIIRARTVTDCKVNQDFEADGYKVVYNDTVGVSSTTIFRNEAYRPKE